VTFNRSVQGVHRVRYCPCLKMEAELASEGFCCFKEKVDRVQNKIMFLNS